MASIRREFDIDFRALFEAVPGNYLILNRDLTIVAASDAYLAATRTMREDVIGRPLFEVFPDNPDDPTADGVANLRASLQRVLEQGRPDRMPVQKYDIPLNDGSGGFEERYWRPLNTPVGLGDESGGWIVHHVEDVTEAIRNERSLEAETAARRKAEQAMRQAQKMEAIGQLTGGIAHDFNNLLTVVGGSIDLIRGDPADPVRVKRLSDGAMTAIERCERLIRQLLMFSRRQVLRPETLNPNRLISDFITLIGRVTAGQTELVTDLSPVVSPVRIDPTQFEAAILNLVVNAREAIEGDGRIVVESRNVELDEAEVAGRPGATVGSYVRISVSDTGRGIPPDRIARVFDPFFTTKEVGRGSGLGLSQVYGFAQESGGHVTIYSEVGIGTTVSLFLPRAADQERLPEPTVGNLPLRRSRANEVVLVVEDDEPVLDMAVESLKELGYAVLTANNAAQALEIIRTPEPIDILFSDVIMPGGMNGAQLAIEARRLRPSLKVLLTSGYTAAALVANHGVEGNLPLLEKPYRPHELAARFRVIAGRG